MGVLPPSLLPVTDQSPAPWSVSIPVREQRGGTPQAPQETCLQAFRVPSLYSWSLVSIGTW